MSIDLDPKEVLEHLRSLGYHHVSREQLKQFIKDLKRLIKNDLRKALSEECENKPQLSSTQDLPDGQKWESRVLEGSSRRVLADRNQAEKPYVDNHATNKSVGVQTLISRQCRPQSPLDTLSNSVASSPSSFAGSVSSQCCSCKADSCPCFQSKTAKKSSSSKKEKSSSRPLSSFIRAPPGELRSGKTDPVTLFHYYQSLWARQSRPGENPHADVRWRIRHKMMAPTALKSCSDKVRENPPWVD